jgi:hypothetical protein
MFWIQLRTVIDNVSKNCSRLQLGLQHTHSYFVWTHKTNLLLEYTYKIIYSIFRINQRYDFFWAQQKILMLEFWSWSILGGIKIFYVSILIMIKSRLHQNFRLADSVVDKFWSLESKYLTLGFWSWLNLGRIKKFNRTSSLKSLIIGSSPISV